ncbi:MAG: hypothetical protein R3C24_06365 [Cyanobacteriota/Melainabacteria group bacterium]
MPISEERGRFIPWLISLLTIARVCADLKGVSIDPKNTDGYYYMGVLYMGEDRFKGDNLSKSKAIAMTRKISGFIATAVAY